MSINNDYVFHKIGYYIPSTIIKPKLNNCISTNLKQKKNISIWNYRQLNQLSELVKNNGQNWNLISQNFKDKTPKQCRERWLNHNSFINKNKLSNKEKQLIIIYQKKYGNKWSIIAKLLPNRSGNQIKNYWHSNRNKNIYESELESKLESELESELDYKLDYKLDNIEIVSEIINKDIYYSILNLDILQMVIDAELLYEFGLIIVDE